MIDRAVIVVEFRNTNNYPVLITLFDPENRGPSNVKEQVYLEVNERRYVHIPDGFLFKVEKTERRW